MRSASKTNECEAGKRVLGWNFTEPAATLCHKCSIENKCNRKLPITISWHLCSSPSKKRKKAPQGLLAYTLEAEMNLSVILLHEKLSRPEKKFLVCSHLNFSLYPHPKSSPPFLAMIILPANKQIIILMCHFVSCSTQNNFFVTERERVKERHTQEKGSSESHILLNIA